MILVLAGTQDGRQIVLELAKAGLTVMASVVSSYGHELLKQEGIIVNDRPLDGDELIKLVHDYKITDIIDATHPYAMNISKNAMEACASAGIRYLRYERPAVSLPDYTKLYTVVDYLEAAKTAAHLGKVIFLTTGSRMLSVFKGEPLLSDCRLIARVLPDPAVIISCLQLGFTPGDLIAMQGPFSHELNIAMFREYKADVIITKNSGYLGGSDTKLTAAMELALPIIVINRPAVVYTNLVYTIPDVLRLFIKDK